jgi:protein-glutamine gamma-glutamyltransferase
MTFERYLRLFSILLILTGFSAILITQTYLVPVTIGIGITLLYAFTGERLTTWLPVPRTIWNVTALLLLAYFLYDSFFGSFDLVGNAVTFVVYLQTVRLLSPKTDRDWIQIYALSFLHLLASTVVSSDVSFALPFLLYIVIAAWVLVLFNLKLVQQEAARPAVRSVLLTNLFRSRDVITSRFLATTSLLSVALILITMVIFFTFPRLSMGRFLQRITRTQAIAGFTDHVELGTIGSIKTNNTVALRVEIPETAGLDIEHLYWRGTAADAFDGRTWSQSMAERHRARIDFDRPVLRFPQAPYPGGKPFTYTVFSEALSTPLLFGADRMTEVAWDKNIIERIFRGSFLIDQNDPYQSWHFQNAQGGYAADLTYRVTSMVGEPDEAMLREDGGPLPYSIRDLYLKLPRLDPEVRKLLTEIPTPGRSTYDQATAIERYLEKNYGYTLDVQDIGTTDPLRFFLIESKKGHCEYFSTALAIALRVHGIPAREVMGFRGGELNPYGRYLAVRQRDAHTWVEVYFPTYGWIRFDPSPLDRSVRIAGTMFQPLAQMVDYLRLRWNKYIIEYDLRAQTSFFEKIGRRIARIGLPENDKPQSTMEAFRDFKRIGKIATRRVFFAFVGLILLASLIRSLLRIRLPKRSKANRFTPVLRLLKSKGHERKSSQTVKEFTAAVEKKTGPIPSLRDLAEMYYDERFGGRDLDESRWDRKLAELRRVA